MLKRLWNKAVKLQEQRANYWKLRNMTDRAVSYTHLTLPTKRIV